MICRNCGAQIDDTAIFCPNCGNRTNGDLSNKGYGYNPYETSSYFGPDTQGSRPVAIASFLFWQVGLVLWLVWRRTRPGKARSALKGLSGYVGFRFPIAGLVMWLMWRHDAANRDYAKIGGISAIVGASVSLVFGGLLIILAASGILELPDIYNIIEEANMAFIHFRGLF